MSKHKLFKYKLPALMLLGLSALPAAAESWHSIGSDKFYLPDGLYRSQGLATDGTQWFFSWQYGLERADLNYNSLQRNSNYPNQIGIPTPLLAQGSNHIGDIDYYNGKIYAPIENGPSYTKPYIGVFNASDLSYTGTSYLLDQTKLTEGVPWVAVDGANNLAYTAEWNNTSKLNVYSLSDFTFLRNIDLGSTIGRIQGAKVHDGALYAASDNASQSVYKISLETGAVEELFNLYDANYMDWGPNAHVEVEGIAFHDTPAGSIMDILVIHGTEADGQGLNLNSTTLHVSMEHFALDAAAVPLPGAWLLFGSSVGLLGAVRRRRFAAR
jgi:hypothetical protein